MIDAWIVMAGHYHEEVPVGAFRTLEAAQASRDGGHWEQWEHCPWNDQYWTNDDEDIIVRVDLDDGGATS